MAICYILGDKVKKLESGLGERFFVFKERNDFFMQKNRLKKKAALTMAVLGGYCSQYGYWGYGRKNFLGKQG